MVPLKVEHVLSFHGERVVKVASDDGGVQELESQRSEPASIFHEVSATQLVHAPLDFFWIQGQRRQTPHLVDNLFFLGLFFRVHVGVSS